MALAHKSAFALAAIVPLTLGAQQPGTQPGSNGLPSVSPDGSRVLFLSDRDGTHSVFVVGADGRGERQVTRGGAQRARWSTDGREIHFAGEGPDTGRVFAVAPDGGDRRVAATIAGRSPVLSPDGKLVAYLVGPWTSTALAVANVDGSGAKVVAGGRATAWNPAWSPDGKRIAYTYGDSSRVLQVHLVNVDGTGDRAVTRMVAEEGSAQMPCWSPDGRRLAVQVSNGRAHSGHIWIVDLGTGAPQKLAAHAEPYLDEAPAWFPDGRHIAFQSNRSGRMEIWVMRDDGSGPRQVTGVQGADLTAQATESGSTAEDSVRAVELARARALLQSDTAVLSHMVADEFVEISRLGQLRTKADNIRDIASGALKLSAVKYDSLAVRIYGDVAVLRGIADNTGTFRGMPFSGKIRYTRVFVRRDGRWQAVAMQQTASQ